jgi:hypothetical protein
MRRGSRELARARTAAWLQAEARRRQAANRAVSIERNATRPGLERQGLHVVSLSYALDEDDPVQVLPVHGEQERRRRTG